jgi:hypothetical protein
MRAADAPTLHRGVVAILCPRLYPTRYAYACGILVYPRLRGGAVRDWTKPRPGAHTTRPAPSRTPRRQSNTPGGMECYDDGFGDEEMFAALLEAETRAPQHHQAQPLHPDVPVGAGLAWLCLA